MAAEDDHVDYVQLVRPAQHETDYDWACALDEELFIANELRDSAEWAMADIEQRVKAWREEKDATEKWLKETEPDD